MKRTLLLTLFVLNFTIHSFSQKATLAFNLNTKPGAFGSGPSDFIVFKEKLYFVAFDNVHGRELWVYDGKNKPTLVKDIYRGYKSSHINELTVCGSKLYFTANDKEHGEELWVHDGKTTKLALDFYKGKQSSNPVTLTAVEDKLFFSARDGKPGEKVWMYDGQNPPEFVVDLWPDREADYFENLYFTKHDVASLNDNLLLSLPLEKYGSEIASYNIHTKEYTYHDIKRGEEGSSPTYFTHLNNKVYFAADDGIHGRILWYYDGKETKMTNDLFPEKKERIENIKVIGKELFIKVLVDKKSYSFKLNNQTNIVEPIEDIYGEDVNFFDAITCWKKYFYFLKDGGDRKYILMKTDGKSAPLPVCFKDTMPLEIQLYPTATEYNGKLYFTANNKETGFELWAIENDKPSLVADINVTDESTYVSNMFSFNNELILCASVKADYYRLFKCDGINPPQEIKERQSNNEIQSPWCFVSHNNKLYFLAGERENMNILVYEPGLGARELTEWTSTKKALSITRLLPKNGMLLIEAIDTIDSEACNTWWKLDSSGHFTEIAMPIRDNWMYDLDMSTEWGDKYYFFYSEYEGEKPALWTFDGKKEFKKLAAINPYANISQAPVLFQDRLVFVAQDSLDISTICTYDSINGVKELKFNTSNNKEIVITGLKVFDNVLYFYTHSEPTSRNSIVENIILWKYEGIGSPSIVKEINSKGDVLWPIGLTTFKNEIYFGASVAYKTNIVYKYSVNEGLKELDNPNLNFEKTFEYKDKLYFVNADKNELEILWQFNGTENPTPLSKKIDEFSSVRIKDARIINDKLILVASQSGWYFELWEFDGENPPKSLTYKSSGGARSIMLSEIYNNKLYFIFNKEFSDYELWCYDGTTPPKLVESLVGKVKSNILAIKPVAGKLFIKTDNGLLYYDGKNPVAKAETYKDLSMEFVKTISTQYKGKWYGAPIDSEYGRELISFDSLNHPKLLKDIRQGTRDGFIGSMVIACNSLCFLANDGKHGEEIWIYDGKNEPTILTDIVPDERYMYYAPSSIKKLIPYKNKLCFVAEDDKYGEEIWVWDGVNKPCILADLNPGREGSEPKNLFVHNDKLYFVANDGSHGVELWEYNGQGKPKILDINRIQYDGNPSSFFSYKNYLFFAADDGIHGEEPWMYDGINPPRMIKDINPGKEGSYPERFTELNGIIYFFADDKKHGNEMWKLSLNP